MSRLAGSEAKRQTAPPLRPLHQVGGRSLRQPGPAHAHEERLDEHLFIYRGYIQSVSHGGFVNPGELRDPKLAAQVAETMQALATSSRVRILACLYESPRSVGELSDAIGMEGSAVSHQLRILRHLGLVLAERDGRRVVYSLHDEHVGSLLEEAMSHVEHLRLGLSRNQREEALGAS